MLARVLWTLFALFVLRVSGQALVAFFDVRVLPPMEAWYSGLMPPMEAWYSGLMPYEYLLPAQILIVVLMAKICVDFTRRQGFFFEPRRFLGRELLWFGYLYLAAMLARAIFLWDRPIPIVFHWVLATFVILVGLSHRSRLAR